MGIVAHGAFFLIAIDGLDRGIKVEHQRARAPEMMLGQIPINAQQLVDFLLGIKALDMFGENGVTGKPVESKLVSHHRILFDGLEMIGPL